MYLNLPAEKLSALLGALRSQLTTCRPGGTVLDIGGNIGIFSLWASERVGPPGRVVAVEPLPPIFDALVHNIAAHTEWCHRTGAPGFVGAAPATAQQNKYGGEQAALSCWRLPPLLGPAQALQERWRSVADAEVLSGEQALLLPA